MKKDELYNILNAYKFNSKDMAFINDIVELKGKASKSFTKLLLEHKDVLDKKNIKRIYDIFLTISEIDDEETKEDIYVLIDKLLSNDILINADILKEILSSCTEILEFPTYNIISMEEDDYEFKYFILEEFVNIFERISKYEYDEIYNQDYIKIIKFYEYLLNDLYNTELEKDGSSNIKNRIKIFTSILTKRENISLSQEKYEALMSVAVSITNINKLIKFINRVSKLGDLELENYINKIDKYTDEVSMNTTNILLNILKKGLKEEKMNEELKKLLLNNETGNIIKF